MQSGATIDNDGLVNFIPTGNAESGTIPATMYANGAAVPTTGTGGSPTATFTITTTDPLQGSKSFLFTPGALGDGVAIPFTVTRDSFGGTLQVACSYEIATAASFVDGDLTFYVKCPSGTIQQCVNFQFLKASGPMQFKALFQAEASGTQYYLLIHQATANTAYGSVKLDSITSGPQQSTVVATGPVGEIIATGSLTPPSGFLYCNGNAVSRTTYAALFAAIGTTFGSGDGSTTFNVPDLRGIFMRGAGGPQNINGTNYSGTLGGKQNDNVESHTHAAPGAGQGSQTVAVSYFTYANQSNVGYTGSTTSYGSGTETYPANVGVAYHIRFQASTIASSEASDGRPVAFKAYQTANQTGINTNASAIKVQFGGVAGSDNGFSTANSRFVAQSPGWYDFASTVSLNAANILANNYAIDFYKNGAFYEAGALLWQSAGLYTRLNAKSSSIWLNFGDYVEVWLYGNGNNSVNQLSSDSFATWFSGQKTSSGSSIAFNGTIPFAGVGLGTAAKPPMTFFGDSNTGLYSPAADTVGVTTNGVERLRVASDGQLSAVVPGGSTLYPGFVCRAWVNFNATGAKRGDGGVTSVSDNGVGDWTINLATAMPDANYAVTGSARYGGAGDTGGMGVLCIKSNIGSPLTTTAAYVRTFSSNGIANDSDFNSVAIFR